MSTSKRPSAASYGLHPSSRIVGTVAQRVIAASLATACALWAMTHFSHNHDCEAQGVEMPRPLGGSMSAAIGVCEDDEH